MPVKTARLVFQISLVLAAIASLFLAVAGLSEYARIARGAFFLFAIITLVLWIGEHSHGRGK